MERTCRVCGCWELDPCIDQETGFPCHWVEPDLCSACAELPSELTRGAILL